MHIWAKTAEAWNFFLTRMNRESMRAGLRKKKMQAVICITAVLLLIAAVLFISTRKKAVQTSENVQTETDQILAWDMETEYPQTVREVLKHYNEVISCLYNEEYSETEFTSLAELSRTFLDEEFLDSNPWEDYKKELKQDIETYHEKNKMIVSSAVDNNNEIKYKTVDGDDCANAKSSYYIKENGTYSCIYKMYVMRKDTEGNWKILVSYQVNGDSSDDR